MADGSIRADRFHDLLTTELPPNPAWIEPCILPKKGIWLLGGEKKIGKSFIMTEAARALTTGTPLFGKKDFYTLQCRVLMIEAEVGIYGLQDRGRKMFAGPECRGWEDRFFFKSKEPKIKLDTYEGNEILKALIHEVRPNVLIFDPISSLSALDENSNTDIEKLRDIFRWLQSIRPSDELSIIFSHHFKKPPDNPQVRKNYDFLNSYNFRGAGKWGDMPDSLMTMHKTKAFRTEENHKAWNLRIRWELRHSEEPPEMELQVNAKGDLRPYWIQNFDEARKLRIKPVKNIEEEAVQLNLPVA